MNDKQCMNVIDEIFVEIFGQKSPVDINGILEECAFDIKLPNKVLDAITGDETWASSVNSNKYISQTNMEKYDTYKGWMIPKKEIKSLDDIFTWWDKVNYTTTERIYDSTNISKSDTIYNCENIYRSQDCRKCRNAVFSGIFSFLDHSKERVYVGHAGAEDCQLHAMLLQERNARLVDKVPMLRDFSRDIGVKHNLAVDCFIQRLPMLQGQKDRGQTVLSK